MSFEVKLPPEEMAKLELPVKRKLRLPARGVLVGGLLAVIAAAILLRSFVFLAGYNTTLVANLGVVRAPVSGLVRELSANAGDRVTQDQQIGVFAAPVGLASALRAGSEDIDQLQARLANLDNRIATLRADAATIRGEAQSYRAQKVSQHGAIGAEASAEVAAANSRVTLAQQQLWRVQTLADRGFVSTAGLEKARAERDSAIAARAAASARQRNQAIQLQAARQGLLLDNGYSDVQYSTQRLSDLTLALSQLQGERDNTAASLDQARQLSSNASGMVSRQLQIPLLASVTGRVWAKLSAAGESVREGEPVYTLADCGSFFAFFTVGRGAVSQLAIGKPVTFIALSGGHRWPGQIVNLGAGDPTLNRLTGKIAEPGVDEYLVGARIVLPEKDRRACPVGTAGRVILRGE